MIAQQINEDDIITSDQLPEPARVINVRSDGTGWRVMAVGIDSNQFYDRTFRSDEVQVRRVTFAADGERFRLAALAARIRAAAQYDPRFAVGVSQVDPLPHQIDAVYNYLLRSPRIRFLLADDPGAGKTIMAGLLLKELENRGVVERTLIVTPANLTMQWQDELLNRFGADFTIIRREQLQAAGGSQLWRHYPRAIISIDFAKRDEVMATMEGVKWDLIIVDEAHKMAAYKYGQKIDKTQAYRLGEQLGEQTDHLLLMTATPHRGNPDNFRLLLSLLDRDMFQTNETLGDILRQKDLPIFLRRLKERMTSFENKPLFPPRNVDTKRYTLEGIELELYNRVTEYVVERFQRAEMIADDRTRRNVGLALAVLQRRLASSLRAIRTSLGRLEEKRRAQLEVMRTSSMLPNDTIPSLGDDEPDDDEGRWEREECALGAAVLVSSIQEMEREIAEVHELYELAKQAEREAETSDAERKLAELRNVLHKPLEDGEDLWKSGEKLLVFTENRDTLNYLTERFHAWGFKVAQIYGGMNQDARRAAQAHFKADDGAQIMVATEAAGEGINLQFCRLMVNYDIPWNPNRLEQRMGRIHRYGQKHSVRIFNLVADNTREGDVLDAVLQKLDRMRTDLGAENVYDIIGDLFSATDLADLVQRAVKESQSLEQIQAAVDKTLDANEQKRKVQAALVDALAADALAPEALEDIREQVRTANEQRLVPEYVERFVVSAFRTLARDKGLKADIRLRANEPGVWVIDAVPQFIRLAAPKGHSIKPSYPQIVFSKALHDQYPGAALVGPGHPLFDALLTLVQGTYGDTLTQGAQFAVPPSEQGLFWLLETTVKDGTGSVAGQQLVGVRQAPDGSFSPIDPLALLDVEPIAATGEEDEQAALPQDLRTLAGRPQSVETWCKEEILTPYLATLRDRRQHEANVREDYLQRSLDTLIAEQTTKILMHASNERERNRDVNQFDIGLRRLEQGLEEYQSRLEQRMDQSARMRALGADAPRMVGVCAYVPAPDVLIGEDEDSDPETEAVAVALSQKYERDYGREPHSVESSNLGFDLRSRGEGELRYIEVKGRKGTGAVSLTANEWIKAARFGSEYWLYVVYDCATPHPRLIVIKDPAKHLTVTENTATASRFRVNVGEVTKHGSTVGTHGEMNSTKDDVQ